MPLRSLALLGVLVCTGCASANTPTLASRFIREGTPTVDLGGPRPAFKNSTARRPMADAGMTTGVSRSTSASSLESFNPNLRTALAALTIAPTVEHHLGVARAYRRQGIFDQAYDYLTRSLTVNGPAAAVYDERARLLRDWGQPGMGLADAHRAVYLAPQSPAFRNTLGTVLFRMGHMHDAEEQFERALDLNANAWYALANLCHANLAQGRTLYAIAQCHRAERMREKQQPAPKPRQKPRP